jgi:hypothetical protein
MFTLNECAPAFDPTPPATVTLWHIAGVPSVYPTKIVAEAAARLRFPDETIERRYARLYFRMYVLFDALDQQAGAIDAEDAARGGL